MPTRIRRTPKRIARRGKGNSFAGTRDGTGRYVVKFTRKGRVTTRPHSSSTTVGRMDARIGILIGAAYLLGSVPFGLMVGRAKGIDPRTAGSGNIGATNLGRLLGKRFFFLVFTLDMLKGLVPMVVAGLVLRDRPPERL